MFYKGVLRSYDPENQVGVIYLSELDSEYNFKLSDLPNPSIQPTIDERLKCFVKEVKGHKTIKFIVRLDNNNAPDASYEKLHQIENEASENFDEVSSITEFQKQEVQVESVIPEQVSTFDHRPQMSESVSNNHSDPVVDLGNTSSSSLTQDLPIQALQNNPEPDHLILKNSDESEKLAETTQHIEPEHQEIEDEYLEEDREFFENKKELSKLKKISVFQKIKNSLTYKKRKPKKEKKKVEIYLNPWILLMIIVVPLTIELGDRGYKKYKIYQKEQQEKARLYEIEQKRIVEEQRKKLGKLPDKVLSDETLDELLGKDRQK